MNAFINDNFANKNQTIEICRTLILRALAMQKLAEIKERGTAYV